MEIAVLYSYILTTRTKIIVPDATGIDDVEGFKATVGSRVFRKTFVDLPPLPKQVHENIKPFNPSFEEDEE